jgi:nitrogen-specific signal transduction histidine kinase
MRRAKDLAEAANRLKSEFLANMSHELKTPLNSAMGFIQLAMDKAVDSEQGELLGMALQSSKSLLTLIDSILDFTKMEAGSLSLAPAPFSLDVLIGDCLDALAVEAYAKGLEVSFKRAASLPAALVGDSGLLRHILLNLVDNAVKFTDNGVVGLSVEAAGEDGGLVGISGNRELELVFAVTDTGIGMSSDKIEAAFERFTQLDASITRRAGGTGLGLAIVNRGVELLGGSIHVESEPGKGTRIELRIPFTLDSAAGPPSPSPIAGRSVLVAGFDGRFAAEIGEIVSSMGASVRCSDDVVGATEEELVLADERLFLERDALSGLDVFAGRLVVATRFGSVLRSRLAAWKGVAFIPLPVRADRLAVAVEALSGPIPRNGAAVSRRTLPRKCVSRRPGDAGILPQLSERIDRDIADARLDLAERAIKGMKDKLSESGDEEGARLAFSALLLARKGDAEGMRRLAERIRAALTAERKDEQN